MGAAGGGVAHGADVCGIAGAGRMELLRLGRAQRHRQQLLGDSVKVRAAPLAAERRRTRAHCGWRV
eukprot:359869-Chlamydomonas_euryale.AAC.29